MESRITIQNFWYQRKFGFAFLALGILALIFQSPRYGVAIFAWIAPISLLIFTRVIPVKRKMLWLFLALWVAGILGGLEVAPFPLPVLLVITLIEVLKQLLLFAIDKWATKRNQHFLSTLLFPSLFTVKEFIDGGSGSGVWNSIANTQYSFTWLTQLASITGIWGITFIITWTASVLVWAIQRKQTQTRYQWGLVISSIVLSAVLIFGAIRTNLPEDRSVKKVRVAGVTVPIFPFMEALYKDFSGKSIHVDPKLSQSSVELQQINQALIPFIETQDAARFKGGLAALHRVQDSLFTLSAKAANEGAKIITWSEANVMVFKKDEDQIVQRGKEFAASHRVYFLMTLASVEPGKITPGKKFVENKTVFYDPDGKILNIFFKNKPVPFVESSKPGDGVIPVIPTKYGNVAMSICYDADFPTHMQQLGKKKADLLLLPSGDWFAISPYHSQMARIRTIENGTALFRQVSGGLSLATDVKGRILAQKDFFKEGEKILMTDIAIKNSPTIYSRIGDIWVYLCILVVVGSIGFVLVRKRVRKENKVSKMAIA